MAVAKTRGAPEYEPRSYFLDPKEFGEVDGAKHQEPGDLRDSAQLMASLAQHNAAVVIRRLRDDHLLSVRELARLTGSSEDFLSGQLNGRYPADSETIFAWALATKDVSVLTVFDTLEGFYPTQ